MPLGNRSRPIVGIVSWRQKVTVCGSGMTIFQVDEPSVERVRIAGGLPVLIPHVDSAIELVESLEAVLFTGGDDGHPQSYGASDEGSNINASLDADRSEIALARAANQQGRNLSHQRADRRAESARRRQHPPHQAARRAVALAYPMPR
jgi:gamma-glutamyl-gamma-aminobutyrate hydrolase PuuD